MNGIELLLHVSTHGSFYSEFGISHTIRQRIAHNRKEVGIRKFFIHFIPKRNRYTLQGHPTFFFFFFFFFFYIDLI